MRPSSASFVISQRTMAEMLQGCASRIWRSRGFKLPATAWSRMCVSRFSIRSDTDREDVALDLELTLEAPDEARRVAPQGDHVADRTAVCGEECLLRVAAGMVLAMCAVYRCTEKCPVSADPLCPARTPRFSPPSAWSRAAAVAASGLSG